MIITPLLYNKRKYNKREDYLVEKYSVFTAHQLDRRSKPDFRREKMCFINKKSE